MWKYFFYFSKTERVAVVLLLGLIALASFFIHILPFLFIEEEEKLNTSDISEYFDFINSLEEVKQKKKDEFSRYSSARVPEKEQFVFDPNTADSATFIRLGLKSYQIRNILKYRNKGGRFKTTSDFSRIYGLDEKLYNELAPYISISSIKDNKVVSENLTEKIFFENGEINLFPENKPNTHVQEKYSQGAVIELNAADTIQLKQIPGIGSAFAGRIVNYRDKLGGFYTVEQLKEVYGITSEMYQQLKDWFRVDTGNIRKKQVNKLGIEQLRQHPYINYKQAKVIYELRKNKGKLESLSQIELLEEFTESDIKRLFYYIDFQ